MLLSLLILGAPTIAKASSDELGPNEAALLMVASYFGAAFYCVAYGVDYRSLAEEVDDGMRKNVIQDDALMWLLWNRGFESGKIGMLYSIEAGTFLELKDAPDTKSACDFAYRNAVAISRMR